MLCRFEVATPTRKDDRDARRPVEVSVAGGEIHDPVAIEVYDDVSPRKRLDLELDLAANQRHWRTFAVVRNTVLITVPVGVGELRGVLETVLVTVRTRETGAPPEQEQECDGARETKHPVLSLTASSTSLADS